MKNNITVTSCLYFDQCQWNTDIENVSVDPVLFRVPDHQIRCPYVTVSRLPTSTFSSTVVPTQGRSPKEEPNLYDRGETQECTSKESRTHIEFE